MTFKEKLTVTAYTKILMVNMSDFHEYAEKLLERPIMTHEFAIESVWKQIQDKVRPDFLALCEKQSHFEKEIQKKNNRKKHHQGEM